MLYELRAYYNPASTFPAKLADKEINKRGDMKQQLFKLYVAYIAWNARRKEIPEFLNEEYRPFQFRGRPRKT